MADQIEQLIYLSRATRPMTKRDLDRIGRLAIENNNQLGVTGMLIYARGLFLQLLEGDPVVIESLLEERIRPDGKHEDLRILYRAPAAERVATAWAMKVSDIEQLAFQISQVRFNELIDELLTTPQVQDGNPQDETLPVRLIYAFDRLTEDPVLVG